MSSPVGGTCLRRQKAPCSPSAISTASIAAIRRCSAAPAILPRLEGKRSGAVVFEPHPREFFAPDQPFFRLTPLPVKLELLAALGLDQTFVIDFAPSSPVLSAEAFATDVVAQGLGASHVVVGYDFTYGKGRTGTTEELKALGREPRLWRRRGASRWRDDGVIFSSSQMREHLRQGEVGDAAEQLGYWWRVRGHVERGRGPRQGPRLSHRQSAARARPGRASRHLCRARRCIRASAIQRAGYVGATPDLRRRRAGARGLSPRFCRRSLRRGGRGRVHRLPPPRCDLRQRAKSLPRRCARIAARRARSCGCAT